MTYPCEHISVTIQRSPEDVYNFVANPANLPQWASGLSDASVEKSGEDWITDSPMGKVKIRFAAKNKFGIVDHDVTLPDGEVNYNPFRVIKNGDGSELTFTLFRLPRMSDRDYQADAATIRKDLAALKAILEN